MLAEDSILNSLEKNEISIIENDCVKAPSPARQTRNFAPVDRQRIMDKSLYVSSQPSNPTQPEPK